MVISEYISGERLQQLADHTIVFPELQHMSINTTQLNNSGCSYEVFTTIENISEKARTAATIYVYTQAVDKFLSVVLPVLTQPITLMTGNSDHNITNKYAKYLDSDSIRRWFSQNIHYEHNKLIPIPIGIANSQWPHGNIDILDQIRSQNNEKTNLVYKNFNSTTSSENRVHVDIATTNNGIPMSPPEHHKQYLTNLSRSKFSICPFGAGVDSHRVWESLYLNTVPVVPDCPLFRYYSEELPFVLVKDWTNITPAYLSNQYEELMSKSNDSKKLKLSYWRNQI